MRHLTIILAITFCLQSYGQEEYIIDQLPNGRLVWANLPAEVDIMVGLHYRRIRVPKTILQNPDWANIQSKPNFATVATSGSYVDLSNKPTIPTTGADIGLGNVNNTSDASKPISTLTQTALDAKLGDELSILAYNDLGSPFKAQTVDFPIQYCNTSSNLTDNQIRWIAVRLYKAATITGIRVYSRVAGSYTGDNNNRVGLYSYSGGTLTQVAASANSATLWTSGANAFQTIAFSATYSAQPGIYFVAILYNNSAQTTAPALASGTALNNAAMAALAFTNSAKLYGTSTGNDLPSSIAMSSVTASTVPTWAALY